MSDQYIKVPLTQGYESLVDVEDAERVLAHKWHASRSMRKDGTYRVYASRADRSSGRRLLVPMHRFVIGAGPDDIVDHKNRDTLDNRRSNLRFATSSQNAINTVRPVGVSGYRGVYFHPQSGRWNAKIGVNGAFRSFGYFLDAESAARAYDAGALGIYGEFAVLNFPLEVCDE